MMTLEEQIVALERQRRRELREMTFLFARSRHEVRRALSPDRLIRRHIGVAVAAAAVAGFLLAPRPGPARAPEFRRRHNWWGTVLQVLRRGRHGPGASANGAAPSTGTPRAKGLMELLVTELLTVAARRINWTAWLAQLMPRGRHQGNGAATAEPAGAVADAETHPAADTLPPRHPVADGPINS